MVGGREESGSRGSRCQLDVSRLARETKREGGRERAPMEVVSTIMTAIGNLPMAMGTLHASVHSVYECKVVEGRVQAGEPGVSLM